MIRLKFNEILVKSVVKSIKNQKNSKSTHNLFGVVSRATHFCSFCVGAHMQKDKNESGSRDYVWSW